MDIKLTLKLNKQVIEKAKDYASSHKRSLSRIIESYLKSLINQDNLKDNEEIKISPFVKSLVSGQSLPADIEYKTEYKKHLEEKYH